MDTGIQDAYNLGWKLGLVLGGANAGLLRTYEEERRPVAAAVLGLSIQLRKDFQSSAKRLPGGTEMLQLGVNYQNSSLIPTRTCWLCTASRPNRQRQQPLSKY